LAGENWAAAGILDDVGGTMIPKIIDDAERKPAKKTGKRKGIGCSR
jgi:hypothetical protein